MSWALSVYTSAYRLCLLLRQDLVAQLLGKRHMLIKDMQVNPFNDKRKGTAVEAGSRQAVLLSWGE